MLGEWSDLSRVLFVPDHNTAAVVTRAVYETHGQIWTIVVPKSDTIPDLFTREEAEALLAAGADKAKKLGDGRTAAAIARERGHRELAERLA